MDENVKFKGGEPAIGDSDLARTIKVLYFSYCNITFTIHVPEPDQLTQ